MIAPSEEAIATPEQIEDEIEHEMEERFEEGAFMPMWLRVMVAVIAISAMVAVVVRFGTRLARR